VTFAAVEQHKRTYEETENHSPAQVIPKRVLVPPLDNRLFLAADVDNNQFVTVHSVDCINRKVVIKRVKPGEDYPTDGTWWFDQLHSNASFTFRDYYEKGEEPEFTKLPSGTVRND
jgi:hypothetical protein